MNKDDRELYDTKMYIYFYARVPINHLAIINFKIFSICVTLICWLLPYYQSSYNIFVELWLLRAMFQFYKIEIKKKWKKKILVTYFEK